MPGLTVFAQPSFPSPRQLLNLDSPPGMPTTLAPEAEPYDPGPLENIGSMLGHGLPAVPDGRGSSSLSSGQSPQLADFLFPGADMGMSNPECMDWRSRFAESAFQTPVLHVPANDTVAEDDGDVEEIKRPPSFSAVNPHHEAWVMRLQTPPISGSSGSSSEQALVNNVTNPWTWMVREPLFSASSPEMLTLRFDRSTCGILSVKDGPTENPWRTLIWPLARDNSALYHAIASMTSFHFAQEESSFRIQGIEHMRTSIKALAEGLSEMKLETAIATTLALAFSESWDQHIRTGINHIKGAKHLVNQALIKHRQAPFEGEELARFKFLANTWIYMDVIARLTSVDDDESNDFDVVFAELSDPLLSETQIDPLMGCASSLFPIIGRVTNLVRRVRRTPSNSPAMISQAMDLKDALETWVAASFFERPEDPSTEVEHALQTAEAYRWATLLYLHQAVPEIPSASSAELAKKVLVYLATVPIGSRAIIIQIYPLLAAGCEASDQEDREWVLRRWMLMAQRMKLGILDRCAEVVKEVWDRRDAYRLLSTPNRSRDTSIVPPTPLKRGLSFDDDELRHPLDWRVDNFDTRDACRGGAKRRATDSIFDVPSALRLAGPGDRQRERPDEGVSPGGIDREFTVRGSLHWTAVMADWSWEGEAFF